MYCSNARATAHNWDVLCNGGKGETLLDRLHQYAIRHQGEAHAAEILMSFFRGECLHLPENGVCQLCAHEGE